MSIDHFIAEQPDVLEAVLAAVPPQLSALESLRSTRPIYLVGSGSSLNALVGVESLFSRVIPASVRVRGPLAFLAEMAEEHRRKGIAIFLSQTGTGTATVEAVQRAGALGWRTVSLTAERHSPLGAATGEVVVIPVGREPVGPKTKGYTASVLTLLLLAHALAGAKTDLTGFTEDLAQLIAYARGAVAELAETCEGGDFFMVLGQERHYGTALEGSLKLSEMSGVPAAAFDTEEALHGRFHGLGMFSIALFIAATPVQHDLAATAADVLADLGIRGRILNLAPSLPGPHDFALPWPSTDPYPELDLISAIVPFQLLACELARRKGLPPERMRYPDLPQRLRIATEDAR
jgi:fructoselysine-6-P-deglycase FrlB-like protein